MLDLGSGVVGGACGWVAGMAGLWGVPPTWVWVVGVSSQILEHPTSICDTGVNWELFKLEECFLYDLENEGRKQIFSWHIDLEAQSLSPMKLIK